MLMTRLSPSPVESRLAPPRVLHPPFDVPGDILNQPEVSVNRHDAPVDAARALVIARLSAGLSGDRVLLDVREHAEVEN